VRRRDRLAKPTPACCARRWACWAAVPRPVNSARSRSVRLSSARLRSVQPLPSLGAGAACSPAASPKMAASSMEVSRTEVSWVAAPQPSAPAFARHGVSHAGSAARSPGPAPRPGLPRCGNRHRYCSIAPNRENRDRAATRCCRACPRDVPRSLPGRCRRYRRMRSATGRTTQR